MPFPLDWPAEPPVFFPSLLGTAPGRCLDALIARGCRVLVLKSLPASHGERSPGTTGETTGRRARAVGTAGSFTGRRLRQGHTEP
jgi:hypothetical protein